MAVSINARVPIERLARELGLERNVIIRAVDSLLPLIYTSHGISIVHLWGVHCYSWACGSNPGMNEERGNDRGISALHL
jgi:hypothetical protein